MYVCHPYMIFLSEAGKSENGGTSLVKLLDRRITATFDKCRWSCSTMALMKCVVPMANDDIRSVGTLDCCKICLTAASMPSVTFGEVVAVFTPAMTHLLRSRTVVSTITASVFVPPTSTPIRKGNDAPMDPMFNVCKSVLFSSKEVSRKRTAHLPMKYKACFGRVGQY